MHTHIYIHIFIFYFVSTNWAGGCRNGIHGGAPEPQLHTNHCQRCIYQKYFHRGEAVPFLPAASGSDTHRHRSGVRFRLMVSLSANSYTWQRRQRTRKMISKTNPICLDGAAPKFVVKTEIKAGCHTQKCYIIACCPKDLERSWEQRARVADTCFSGG